VTLGFEPEKVLLYSKTMLLPIIIIGAFLIYFFSISEFSEETYHSIHTMFVTLSAITFIFAGLRRIPSMAMSVAVVFISYLIINSTRYAYGEDYMFSAGYNIWIIVALPNILVASLLFAQNKPYRYWSAFFVFLFAQTAIIEKLQNQSIDADSYFFYKHIGMLNYPALATACICIMVLLIYQTIRGKILNSAGLFISVAVISGLYFSDNLFAFSLFFLAAVLIALLSSLYYAYYILYKDEELNIDNARLFLKDAERKYPLKYSIALMYIDEYNRLIKRYGKSKTLILKKMLLAQIRRANRKVKIYNYKNDALILAFLNANSAETFNEAENIRRILAKSIFVFNENNHLQLTVSQCVSEKKRSDADASVVLSRAEDNLRKACKFTHNITVKA